MPQSTRLAKLFETLADELPHEGLILVLRATDNTAYRVFDAARMHCVQTFNPSCDALIRAGLTPYEKLPDAAKIAIVELSRSKPENLANISKAYDAVDLGATVFIDGAKTDGIDSILKAVKNHVPVAGSYSKAHGKTIWFIKDQQSNPFHEWLNLTDMAKNKDGFWTVPGIFSSDAIDPASALLCPNIKFPLKGKGADLGAGWGYLSHYALKTYPDIKQLDLFEAEQVSLDCAQKNIIDERAQFHWQDVQSMPSKAAYDFILMNPPFHVSRKADPDLGRTFIAKAASMLTPKGRLWMVANKQLAYEATLDTHFHTWSYVEQTGQYKVIHATRPK